MLLQTNSYIVPKDRRSEHQRLVRKFRQVLARLGCDQFEVYEQVGANWSSAEATGRYVQIMRFRDRKHQLAVQAGERTDPMAQRVIAEFCDLINFPYQQQQGLFAVGFYNGVLLPSPSRAAGQLPAAEPAPARAGRRAAAEAGGFGMAGMGAASGLGASAAGSMPSATDDAAAVEDSFGADGEQAVADVPAGEDLAAEDLAAESELEAEPEAQQVAAEEPEPALAEESQESQAEESQAIAEPEEAPAASEVEAAPEPQAAEEAAPVMEESPWGDGEAGQEAEAEKQVVGADEPEATVATAEQAPPTAEDAEDSLLDLEFELPEEAAAATPDATDELSAEFLEDAPEAQAAETQAAAHAEAGAESGAESETEPEAAVAAGQDEGGVEVIYEELPEAPETHAAPATAAASEQAPAATRPDAFPAAEEPAPVANDEIEFAESGEIAFAETEDLARDPEAEADAPAAPQADLLPDEELVSLDDDVPPAEREEEPAAVGRADRNGEAPAVFASGHSIEPQKQDETEHADLAVSAFDNGWEDEPAAPTPVATPASAAPVSAAPVTPPHASVAPAPAAPVHDVHAADESQDETPHPAHEYEPLPVELSHETGRAQRASEPEDLEVLLAELDRALPTQRPKNGDYFADEELQRALDEALREVHAQGAAGGHNNGGHRAGR